MNYGLNRKSRRWLKAIARRAKRTLEVGHGKTAMGGHKFRHTHVNWFKRIAIEMKDNAYVIENVSSGRLDKQMGF